MRSTLGLPLIEPALLAFHDRDVFGRVDDAMGAFGIEHRQRVPIRLVVPIPPYTHVLRIAPFRYRQ